MIGTIINQFLRKQLLQTYIYSSKTFNLHDITE